MPEISPGVWEAEAGISGGAPGQRCSEDAGSGVVVVVDFGRGLAGVGAQDAPGVLEEPSFPSDWGGEEQGVEDWAVEAFAGVWPGGHGEQGRAAGLGGGQRLVNGLIGAGTIRPGRRGHPDGQKCLVAVSRSGRQSY